MKRTSMMLLVIFVLLSSLAIAEDLTYIHDGVMVCTPVEKEPVQQIDKEWQREKMQFEILRLEKNIELEGVKRNTQALAASIKLTEA